MIANLLIFLLTNLENCFFYCEILFDFNYHFAHVFSKENYNLIDQIKSPQQFSEEHSKQQGSNQRPRFNSGRSGRHVSVPPYSESKLSKSVVEKEAPNVFDLRPLKKGESARPICDTSKKFTVILLDGSSYEIPGMPSFKSHDEFFKFRADTVEKTAVQSEILQHKQKVELPPLIEEYSKRKAYNENKNYYLLIHVIGWGSGFITIIPYCIYRRTRLQFNYISGFKAYEKKFQEKVKIKLEHLSFGSEAYYFCSKYIDMSQSFIDDEDYLNWAEKDGFKPLIDALENYRNFCFENGDFYYATVLTKRIVGVSNFKKLFDKRIVGFRAYKKRNPEHKGYVSQTDKITNDDIAEYLK